MCRTCVHKHSGCVHVVFVLQIIIPFGKRCLHLERICVVVQCFRYILPGFLSVGRNTGTSDRNCGLMFLCAFFPVSCVSYCLLVCCCDPVTLAVVCVCSVHVFTLSQPVTGLSCKFVKRSARILFLLPSLCGTPVSLSVITLTVLFRRVVRGCACALI